jgi:hypothetical protein
MFERFKKEFAQLGWGSPQEMAAILAPSAEHTRSLLRHLEQVGFDPKNDKHAEFLADMAEMKSLTKVLLERIKFADDVGGASAKGVFVVTDKTTATELLEAYEVVYKEEFNAMYTEKLESVFKVWKQQLGGK